ncbi:MAG: BglG family transcription antiterminator, partial [Anaerococcus vaginalis]
MRESRIKKIFEILTEDFKPYTAKDLATLIDYSSKTIRDDIKQLNNLLFDNGAYIESKSGVGYKFVINDKEKFSIFIQDIWPKYAIEDEMNSQDYRINYIAVKLIMKCDYIKSDDFLDELYISKSQLNMDLKILKEKLSAYRLKIVSKPHYGMKIIGSEINIRKFLANNIDGLISKEDYKTLSKITGFSIDTIHSIESMVFKTFKKYNFVTNLVKYNNFLIYLIISLYRVSEKREIEDIDNDNIKSKNKEISKVSLEIYNEICRLYKIKFNEAELFYIDINLSTNTDSINTNDLKLEKLIDYILEKIKIAMNINLVDNVNLKSSLKAHLGPMIERGKIGIKLKNPLLEDIKKDHIALE